MPKLFALGYLFILSFTIILVANIHYRQSVDLRSPPGSVNTYATGNIEDYHQYLTFIKWGREGSLLYKNVYSEESIPDVLLQPIYNIVGMLTKPFSLSLYTTYFIFRIIALAILLGSIYTLIRFVMPNITIAFLSAIFFFFATGFWKIISLSPFTIQHHPLGDFNFALFTKYHVIPPHHNVAVALIITAFIMTRAQKPWSTVGIGLVMAVAGLIHPYIQGIGIVVFLVEAALASMYKKSIRNISIARAAWILLCCAPVAGYYVYLYKYILRFEIATVGIFWVEKRLFAISDYLLSLGPLLVLSMYTLFRRETYQTTLLRLILLWAYLPILLFFLPNINIPVTRWRLFQSYQHIPLAILSALSVWYLTRQSKILYTTAAIVLSLIAGIYGAIAYVTVFKIEKSQNVSYYLTIYVPQYLTDMYAFLNKNTPERSVVLGGEQVSNLIPEFTHNRVIVGHNGNNRRYVQKLAEVQQFYTGTLSEEAVKAYLKEKNVSYIIFGVDAPPLSSLPYGSFPFLKEIYKDHLVSIVEVLEK